MNLKMETIEKIIEKHSSQLEWCGSYGEPGYDDPARAILFADWNPVPRSTCDWLESRGFNLEWSDEWTIDHDDGMRAWRTSPDSHGWRPSFVYLDDCSMITRANVVRHIDDYIAWLSDNPEHVDQLDVDWTEHGFTRINEDSYEAGLHPGQTDDPREILAKARKARPDHEFIFVLDGKGQFDMSFSIWSRPVDRES